MVVWKNLHIEINIYAIIIKPQWHNHKVYKHARPTYVVLMADCWVETQVGAYNYVCSIQTKKTALQLTCYNNDNNTDQYYPIEQPSPQCYPVGHLHVE